MKLARCLTKAVSATGGVVTDTNGYRIHTFTSSGTFTVTAGGSVEALVVAGGAGGRIALVVRNPGADFLLSTGPVLALGGGAPAGAGTIYRQCASDQAGRGTALIANNSSGYTDVSPGPPNVMNEVNFASFFITNSATLRLTNNYTIGDIFLQSAGAWLDLGSNTLTVRSRAHALGVGVVTNYGAIVWWPDIPKGVVFSTW